MRKLLGLAAVCLGATFTCGTALADTADFSPFNIRNSNASGATIVAPWDASMSIVENAAGDGFSASTPLGGQKVGYGTSAFDGMKISSLDTVNFTTTGSTNPNPPYLNLWVTDGANFAVIASENAYRGTNFATRQEWKVFEYDAGVGTDLNWLFASGTGARDGSQYLTLNGTRVDIDDFANNIVLGSPTSPYPTYVGTGAPRGGFGFNLVFGDTAANFVGSYAIEDLTVTVDGTQFNAVPLPSAAWAGLGMLGALGVARVIRRRPAQA